LQLGNALLQLLLLAKTVLVAQFKKLALARERLFDVRFVEAAGNLGRHRHGVRSVALGGEPRLARVKFNEAFVDDRQIGAGYGLIEAEENIAGFDMIAIAHEKFTTPPVGCCTFFTLVSTTIEPCAISAPEIWAVDAQPPNPITSTPTKINPARMCRRIDSLALVVGPA
jgi:hypothetical protein